MHPSIRRYKRRTRDMRRENIEKENKGGILLAVAMRLMKRLCQIVKKDGYGYGGDATTLLITLTVHLSALKTSVSGKDGEGVRLSGLSSPSEGRNA